MSGALEEDWLRLERHLRFADRFWFGVVLARDLLAAHELRRRATALLAVAGRAVVAVQAETPEALRDALATPEGPDGARAGMVWIEAVRRGPRWDAAWKQFLLRANELRERWREGMSGALVLVGPPELASWARENAPDLWSVRAFVSGVAVEPTSRGDVHFFVGPSLAMLTSHVLDGGDATVEPDRVEALVREATRLQGQRGPRAWSAMAEAARALAMAGHPEEARGWMERLERAKGVKLPPRTLARAWAALAHAEAEADDIARARTHIARALQLSGDTVDDASYGWAHLAWRLMPKDASGQAKLLAAEHLVRAARGLQTQESATHWLALAEALNALGGARHRQGDREGARAAFAEALQALRAGGELAGGQFKAPDIIAMTAGWLARAQQELGDTAAALRSYEEANEAWREVLTGPVESEWSLRCAAQCAIATAKLLIDRGDISAAVAPGRTAMEAAWKLFALVGDADDVLALIAEATARFDMALTEPSQAVEGIAALERERSAFEAAVQARGESKGLLFLLGPCLAEIGRLKLVASRGEEGGPLLEAALRVMGRAVELGAPREAQAALREHCDDLLATIAKLRGAEQHVAELSQEHERLRSAPAPDSPDRAGAPESAAVPALPSPPSTTAPPAPPPAEAPRTRPLPRAFGGAFALAAVAAALSLSATAPTAWALRALAALLLVAALSWRATSRAR